MAETPTTSAPATPEQTMPLLALITQRSLDADYEHVAARKRAAGQGTSVRQVPRRTAAVVLLAFGLLVTVAAVQTSRNATADEASRSSLIDQVNLRRQAVAAQQRQLARAQTEALALQRSLTRATTESQAAQARVTRIQGRSGFASVKGPGIQATVTSAPDSDANQLVRDSDLALLTDALWSVGAEAISVNGERLTVLSSFRNVGTGILVNSRPVTPPYVFDVVGNPATLPANLLSSPVGGQWYALKDSLGFSFDVRQAANLTLPAAPPPRLRSARTIDLEDPDTRTQGESPS